MTIRYHWTTTGRKAKRVDRLADLDARSNQTIALVRENDAPGGIASQAIVQDGKLPPVFTDKDKNTIARVPNLFVVELADHLNPPSAEPKP